MGIWGRQTRGHWIRIMKFENAVGFTRWKRRRGKISRAWSNTVDWKQMWGTGYFLLNLHKSLFLSLNKSEMWVWNESKWQQSKVTVSSHKQQVFIDCMISEAVSYTWIMPLKRQKDFCKAMPKSVFWVTTGCRDGPNSQYASFKSQQSTVRVW